MADLVLVDTPAEGVARITLNRPDARNALNVPLATELVERLSEAQCNRGVRAVVLAGAGKSFCAGGDIPAMREAGDGVDVFLRKLTLGFHGAVAAIHHMPKPVIAAVRGAAGGGGLSLALACDLVICADDAKLVSAYTAIGLTPDGGLTFQLTRALGPHRALAHILRNEPIRPADALASGLVHTVAPSAEVDEKAVTLAAELAAGPTGAFAAAKRMVWRHDTLEATLEAERQNIADRAATADGREGVAAFLEKRKPQFTGA
jgi:2-(1,2-epoxy-1,2-dihydrophenyl)acetyl-CoA isomerase